MNWLKALRVAPLFIHSSLVILSTEARKCYLPNGELEPNDQPCFPQNPESSCCGGSTYVCATNNMCAYYDGSYYVIGSCTDKTWNSPACPSYCFFMNHVHNTVFRCSADTYCCADGPNCNCTTGVNTREIQDFLPEYSELVGSSVSLNTMVITTSLMTPPGATRTPETSEVAGSVTQLPGTANTTSMSSATASASANPMTATNATTATANTPSSEPKSPGMRKSTKVGLGVGISLGVIVIALAVLLWMVWRRWKRKQALTAPAPQFQFQYPADPKPVYEMVDPSQSSRAEVYEAPGHEAASS